MSFLIIPLTDLIASILTFFSGFGLGTILLPVFTLYYPTPIAIGLTAMVHFSNNLFKIGLVYKQINWKIVLKFGAPSLLAALIGAIVLENLSELPVNLFQYQITNHEFQITLFNLIIGTLIIVFSLFEVLPYLKNISFYESKLTIGGFLSGFFGGLSGHQGALRSAFLIKLNLPKETFVATGTAIACIVDVSRLTIYAFTFNFSHVQNNLSILLTAVSAAIIGALIGNKLLKKTTLGFMKWFVTLFMSTIALLMILGIIN